MAGREGELELGDRRLAWRSIGQGPPLLLVNGYAATTADWDPTFLASLSAERELICPDNRGLGGSGLGDLAAEPLTIDSMAADLEALLDERELARLPVAGWSMGGFVAQTLARRAPERVEALVLLATDPGGPAAVPAAPGTWAQLVDSSGTPREQASRLISLLFPPCPAAEIDRQFGDLVAAARERLDPAALRAQEEAMAAWHAAPPPPLGPDAPPVLAAHGAEDVVIPPENLDALTEAWPRCRADLFGGCGHAFMAQEPETVAELITSFLPG